VSAANADVADPEHARRFMRTIPMPENADPNHALAKFDNGVLTLTVPKTEPARSASRTIDIE
jgi:HSP20 family protein